MCLTQFSCSDSQNNEKNPDVHLYEMVEASFTASVTYGNPYLDVDLWVDLEGPDNLKYRIPAFWDGGQTWRVRMVATAPGNWSWSTSGKTGDPGLDKKSGSFSATKWTKEELDANINLTGFCSKLLNTPPKIVNQKRLTGF